jgi:hypothetical protein
MYFNIIFANHIAAVFLPLAYFTNIYSCVVAYVHFILFCSMVVNTICLDEPEEGQGGRTTANRVFWFCNRMDYIVMCVSNLANIVGGLIGIPMVLQ